MKFQPLGSSSHGNAYLVDDGESVLLLECGLSFRRLGQLVRGAGYRLSDLAGCLITHEHKDHARCWERLSAYGIPLYASHGTIAALEAGERITPLAPEVGQDISVPVRIGSFDALSFRTYHDAKEPVGYLLRSRVDGEKLAFATDTVNLNYRFPGLTMLAIEANYEESILAMQTRVPETVVRRIQNSHMEIGRLCGYLEGLPLEQCREVYLLHLSDACSDEAWFEERACRVVPKHVKVIVCPKGG